MAAVPTAAPPEAGESVAPGRAPRTHLYLAATLTAGGRSDEVRVRNLSEMGARIDQAKASAVGTSATLTRGSLRVDGKLVWQSEKGCGLRFETPIVVAEWMAPVQHGGQVAVDQSLAVIRKEQAGGSAVRSAPAWPEAERADSRKLAVQLVEQLSLLLADDKDIIERHGQALQALDLVAQLLTSAGGEAGRSSGIRASAAILLATLEGNTP